MLGSYIRCSQSLLFNFTASAKLAHACVDAGFDTALRVLQLVGEAVPITVVWVCQQQPTLDILPGLASCNLDIRMYVAPSQVRTKL